ncbi:MAG: hypothetical protein Q9169_002757 [Polycauliona sp. 2 TL-2023]
MTEAADSVAPTMNGAPTSVVTRTYGGGGPTSKAKSSATQTSTTSKAISDTSPSSASARATDVPQQPSKAVLSTASKAGIGVGIPIAVVVACVVIFLLYRRLRAGRILPSEHGQLDPDNMEQHVMEPKEWNKPPDPPPSYPYDKATPSLDAVGIFGSNPDDRCNSRGQHQCDGSGAGFYAQSSKQERSHGPKHDPDGITHHGRPELDSIQLHEAPESSKNDKIIGELTTATCSSQPPTTSSVDLDHLSKLEQEERQLQEDIEQIGRLERLKVGRDRIRQKIKDMSEQPRRDSA